MTTTNTTHVRYRAPRLGVAALLCLGSLALAPAPFAAADPAGNNGTVKIAPLGEIDSIPNNTPHVGCSFEVEWYGFDEGADIISSVTFEEQAPTTDVGMTVSGPSQVFVGADDASGAGTPTGLDGRETYTLAFTGAPHPQQGYHVKLTIATPGSIGNDTKTKVFWVEGCAPATPQTETPETETPQTETPQTETPQTETPQTETPQTETPQTETPQTETPAPQVLPEEATQEETTSGETAPEENAPEVLGVQAFGNSNNSNNSNNTQPQAQQQALPQAQQQALPTAQQQALPTAVNAGVSAAPTAGFSMTQSLLGLLLVLLGALTARLGWIRARG